MNDQSHMPEGVHPNVKKAAMLLWFNLALGILSFVFFFFKAGFIWPVFSYFVMIFFWGANGILATYLIKGEKWPRLAVTAMAVFFIVQSGSNFLAMFEYFSFDSLLFIIRLILPAAAAGLLWLPSTSLWYEWSTESEEEIL